MLNKTKWNNNTQAKTYIMALWVQLVEDPRQIAGSGNGTGETWESKSLNESSRSNIYWIIYSPIMKSKTWSNCLITHKHSNTDWPIIIKPTRLSESKSSKFQTPSSQAKQRSSFSGSCKKATEFSKLKLKRKSKNSKTQPKFSGASFLPFFSFFFSVKD